MMEPLLDPAEIRMLSALDDLYTSLTQADDPLEAAPVYFVKLSAHHAREADTSYQAFEYQHAGAAMRLFTTLLDRPYRRRRK